VAWGIYGNSAAQATRRETDRIAQDSQQMEQVSKKIGALLGKQSEIRKNQHRLALAGPARDAYPKIISELAAKVPDRFLWITEIQPVGDPPQKGASPKSADASLKAVIVKGLYLDNPRQASVIDDFVTSLQSSEPLLRGGEGKIEGDHPNAAVPAANSGLIRSPSGYPCAPPFHPPFPEFDEQSQDMVCRNKAPSVFAALSFLRGSCGVVCVRFLGRPRGGNAGIFGCRRKPGQDWPSSHPRRARQIFPNSVKRSSPNNLP